MTVKSRSKSLRRKRRPKGPTSEREPVAYTGHSHTVKEHSFGDHSSKSGENRSYASSGGPDKSDDVRDSDYSYTQGYEDQIKSIADAISDELTDVYGGPGYPNENAAPKAPDLLKEVPAGLPETIQEEIQSLLNAAVKVGDVIRHFHEVANRTNLFALKLTADAMRAEKGGSDLATQVKDLAEETYVSAEKIYACMYSIQQTIVSIADNRFDDYKHIAVNQEDFLPERQNDNSYKALKAISPRTLKSLVDELDKLKKANKSDQQYKELGNFADQLSAEIENLKEQLQTG